ncbi:MAG: metallophosphoesterase [Pirellulaceae bacterium]
MAQTTGNAYISILMHFDDSNKHLNALALHLRLVTIFKFIHAADIHLDSALKGLQRYEGAPVDEIRRAPREGLSNLVDLAIELQVQFVLIAGDLYDGDWKNFQTGMYFVQQATRLRVAGIPLVFIAGNHDAANKMTRSLPLPDNVTLLSHKKPQTIHLESLDVAIHGQSFATECVLEDLSQAYPAAERGCLNIGLLHTSAEGREGHDRYSPVHSMGSS